MTKYDNDTITQINNSINIVDYAKQYLDLEYKYGEYWSKCCFHKDDLNPSLSFNQEKNLFNCLACNTGGNIIQFVQNYHKLSFPEAIEHLISYGNIDIIPKKHSEILEFLQKTKLKSKNTNIITREYLSDNYINRYSKKPISKWLDEGIKQEILDKYNVRYDKKGNRIVFPIRNSEGKIIAIKGRTLYENYADLGIPKYIYYQKIITNDFLFGLYENLPYIKEKNEVIVLEGAKGVMLAESYGFNNVVSLETDNINEYQKNLLLQLKVNIVFALDKGIKIVTNKVTKIKNSNIYVNIGLLPKLTNVYVMEDKNGLLEEKECPCDQGKEVLEILYEGKVLI